MLIQLARATHFHGCYANPISRLTPEQSIYYFMSGYTARVAGAVMAGI